MNPLMLLLALPDREQVVAVLMNIYEWTFHLVFIMAIGTILYVLWHLYPKKEY